MSTLAETLTDLRFAALMASLGFGWEDIKADTSLDEELCRAMVGLPAPYEVSGVLSWDAMVGHGYVIPDNPAHDRVLIHKVCLQVAGYQPGQVRDGDRVTVLAMERPKGPQAFKLLKLERAAA